MVVERRIKTRENKQDDSKKVQEVLKKRPEVRSEEDVDIIYEWLMENGSTQRIFNGVQDIICKTICREMTLLTMQGQQLVCRQGEFGDTFYIIVSGSVSLLLRDKKDQILYEEAQNNPLQGMENSKASENLGKFIKRLRAGDTFGELAVLDPTAKRSCSIQTDRTTSFICLKRAAYQRMVRTSDTRNISVTQFEFLKSLFYFNDWSQSDLTRVSNNLKFVTFPPNYYMARQGNECTCLYFIVSGEAQEFISMMRLSDIDGKVVKVVPMNELNEDIRHGLAPQSNLKRKKVNLELAVLQSHDICCEYPIVFEKINNHTDIKTLTEVEALAIERNQWSKMFLRDRQDSIVAALECFRMIANARENWRRSRINIATSHPSMLLTITTRKMMYLAKTRCGWCGKDNHVTGDFECPRYIEDQKQKEAIRKRQHKKTRKSVIEKEDRVKPDSDVDQKLIPLNRERKLNKLKIVSNVITKKELCQSSKELLKDGYTMHEIHRKGYLPNSSQERSRVLQHYEKSLTKQGILKDNLVDKDSEDSRIPSMIPIKYSVNEGTANSYRQIMLRKLTLFKSVTDYQNLKKEALESMMYGKPIPVLQKRNRIPRARLLNRKKKFDRWIDRRLKRIVPQKRDLVEESLNSDLNSLSLGKTTEKVEKRKELYEKRRKTRMKHLNILKKTEI